jgi:hypothetical protein
VSTTCTSWHRAWTCPSGTCSEPHTAPRLNASRWRQGHRANGDKERSTQRPAGQQEEASRLPTFSVGCRQTPGACRAEGERTHEALVDPEPNRAAGMQTVQQRRHQTGDCPLARGELLACTPHATLVALAGIQAVPSRTHMTPVTERGSPSGGTYGKRSSPATVWTAPRPLFQRSVRGAAV